MIKEIAINEGLTKYKKDVKINLDSQSAIIFGNNGSGKSSLSKLFFYGNKLINNSIITSEYLSLKNIDADDFNIILKYDNNKKRTVYSSNNISNNIFIPTFNEQYIHEKIGINKHFSENKIENKNYLMETIQSPLKLEYEEAMQKLEKSNSLISEKEKELSDLISKETKSLLSEINSSSSSILSMEKVISFIDENKLKRRFKNVEIEKASHLQFLESIKNVDKLYENDPFFQLSTPKISIDKYKEIISSTNNLISFDENDSKIEYAIDYFEKLEVEYRKWKIDGTKYIDNNKCPFCNSNISNNKLVESYISYSKSKMNECINTLEQNKEFLQNDSASLTRSFSYLTTTYNSLQKIIPENIYNRLFEITTNYQKLVECLLMTINEKLKKQHISKNCCDIIETIDIDNFNLILNSEQQLNKDIQEINQMLSKTTSLKTKRQKEFLTNTGFKIIFNKVKNVYVELKKLINENKTINKDFEKIEKSYKEELKKNNKIILRLNELLQYLNINDYSIDENFDLQLCSKALDSSDLYLSEGEKTAISFALFVSELEFSEISYDTVVIDDPISSLDYNRIYSLYTLIEELIQTQKEKQFIILTHNSLFYNLLSYGANRIIPNNKKVFNFFKLRSNTDNLTDIMEDKNPCSTIYINKALEIYRLKNIGINENSKNYIHNYCRYILETIYNFEYPELTSTRASKQLIDILKKDEKFYKKTQIGPKRLEVFKNLINKGSHASINEIFDKETYEDKDYQDACDITIKIIQYKFPSQYDFLSSNYQLNIDNSKSTKKERKEKV